MSVLSRSYLALAFLLLLTGCSSSDVELATLKKTTSDLNREFPDLKVKVDALHESVARLNHRCGNVEGQYASLHGTVEHLETQNREKELQHEALAETVNNLETSYIDLNKMVADAVTSLSKSRSESEGKKSLDSIGSREAIHDIKESRNAISSSPRMRANAEVCEAIDKYTRAIDSIIRVPPSLSAESKMDAALADFKAVADKFSDQKDATRIGMLAEELKWTAYNARKSRTYLADGGGWKELVAENRTKLRGICRE